MFLLAKSLPFHACFIVLPQSFYKEMKVCENLFCISIVVILHFYCCHCYCCHKCEARK